MAVFPERYKGEELEELHRKVLIYMTEEKISLYENVFYGMADIYGIIPLKTVYRMLTADYGENISEESFLALCEYMRHKQDKHFCIFGKDEYYHEEALPETTPMDRELAHEVYCEDCAFYEKLLDLKKGKPWYVFPREELFTEKAPELKYLRTQQRDDAARWFSDVSGTPLYGVQDVFDDIMLNIHMSDSDAGRCFNDCLDCFQRMGYDPDTEKVKEFIPYFLSLYNNARLPANNGFTPAEAEEMRSGHVFESPSMFTGEIIIDEEAEKKRYDRAIKQRAGMNAMIRNLNLLGASKGIADISVPAKRTVKPGRNDPCPCGSGKKYKKCCGR